MRYFYKVVKNYIIITSVDAFLLCGLTIYINATPDVSIVEILIVPLIFAINIVLAILFRFTLQRKKWATVLFINSIIAVIVFHLFFKLWFYYYDYKNFKEYFFTINGKKYELNIDRRDTSYTFYELFDGSSVSFKEGKYTYKKDSIILVDDSKHLLVFNNKLKGYDSLGVSINLSKER